MDAHDLFRRLSAGAKFDKRRFIQDATKFQVINKSAIVNIHPNNADHWKSKMVKAAASAPELDLKAAQKEPEATAEPADAKVEEEIEIDPKAEIREERKARKRKLKTPKQINALKKEEINQKRKSNRIHVQGSDVPAPTET